VYKASRSRNCQMVRATRAVGCEDDEGGICHEYIMLMLKLYGLTEDDPCSMPSWKE
jgi:hypothetical protein